MKLLELDNFIEEEFQNLSSMHWCKSRKQNISTVSEFNEFEPRLKSAKNRFQFSAGLNLKKFNKSGLSSHTVPCICLPYPVFVNLPRLISTVPF